MSIMSYCTTNQDKYYIPPDADLDEVVGKLMSKKSKHIQKMEKDQESYFSKSKRTELKRNGGSNESR